MRTIDTTIDRLTDQTDAGRRIGGDLLLIIYSRSIER
jgi:hypothetical protein